MRGYTLHRRPGTRNGLRWALAQGGLMLVVILGAFALATVINPIVVPNRTLGGDAWLGLMATAVILGTISGVLWERNRHRQRIASVLVVAVCLITVGLIGLMAGGPWTLIGIPSLVVGITALFIAAVQGVSDLTEAAGPTSKASPKRAP